MSVDQRAGFLAPSEDEVAITPAGNSRVYTRRQALVGALSVVSTMALAAGCGFLPGGAAKLAPETPKPETAPTLRPEILASYQRRLLAISEAVRRTFTPAVVVSIDPNSRIGLAETIAHNLEFLESRPEGRDELLRSIVGPFRESEFGDSFTFPGTPFHLEDPLLKYYFGEKPLFDISLDIIYRTPLKRIFLEITDARYNLVATPRRIRRFIPHSDLPEVMKRLLVLSPIGSFSDPLEEQAPEGFPIETVDVRRFLEFDGYSQTVTDAEMNGLGRTAIETFF